MADNGGYSETVEKRIGRDRQVVTPIDEFRASQFTAVVLSGADGYVSGQTVLSVVASSIVRIRVINIHLHNRETANITVLFRDGGITGGVVAGPFRINPTTDRTIPKDELMGRFFLSSIYAVVLSGTYSAGSPLDIGYILEPIPTAVGGWLE